MHDVARLANSPATIRKLLNQGADPNTKNGLGLTPLQAAVDSQDVETAKVLLEDPRTDVNAWASVEGPSALSKAVGLGNEALVKALLAKKPRLDMPGDMPLTRAVQKGDEDMVKLLLDHDLSADVLADALCKAIINNRPVIGKLLLTKAKQLGALQEVLSHSSHGGGVLHQLGSLEYPVFEQFIQLFLQQGMTLDQVRDRIDHYYRITKDQERYKSLVGNLSLLRRKEAYERAHASAAASTSPHVAAETTATAVTEDMIQAVRSLKASDSRPAFQFTAVGFSALAALLTRLKDNPSLQVRGEAEALAQAVVFGDKSILKALLNRGANPNTKNAKGESLLHAAATWAYDPALITLLLDLGANASTIDQYDRDPTFCAIGVNNLVTLRVLLNHSDISVNRYHGFTWLLYAMFHSASLDMIKLLVDKGCSVNDKYFDNKANNKLDSEGYRKLGHFTGWSAIHFAVLHNDTMMVSYLLDVGAQIDLSDSNVSSPLHMTIRLRKKKDIIHLLLAKADELGITKRLLNQPDHNGETLLTYAFQHCDRELIQLLISKGADVAIARKSLPDQMLVDSLLRQIGYSL